MKKNLKNFSLALTITGVFSVGLYYIIGLYDKSGTSVMWIHTNVGYLVFLFSSIVISLTLYGSENKKNKLILFFIVLINFLYIIFSFVISNIGLNNTQGLFLVGFLLLAFLSSYIKNRFGYIITGVFFVGILATIGSAIIPLYETGPDITGFEKQYSTQLITYSKVNINQSKAKIHIDNKEYNLSAGLISHSLKINKSGSQILFKSDKKYLNTFGYILFPDKEIIQIYPQSALNIKKIDTKYQIKIIAGTIKHNIATGKTNNSIFYFTGDLLSYGIMKHQDIKQISEFYDNMLKKYIRNQIGGDTSNNKIIIYISKYIITFLSKIVPTQFNNNLKNFNNFQTYINEDNKIKLETFDNNSIKNGFFKNILNSLETTKFIK